MAKRKVKTPTRKARQYGHTHENQATVDTMREWHEKLDVYDPEAIARRAGTDSARFSIHQKVDPTAPRNPVRRRKSEAPQWRVGK